MALVVNPKPTPRCPVCGESYQIALAPGRSFDDPSLSGYVPTADGRWRRMTFAELERRPAPYVLRCACDAKES